MRVRSVPGAYALLGESSAKALRSLLERQTSLLRGKVVVILQLSSWQGWVCDQQSSALLSLSWKVLVTLLTRPCWLGREPWGPGLQEWAEMVAGGWMGKPL